MAALLVLQIALGIGAWWLLRPYDGIARAVTLPAALIRTGHQANAGLLLASAVVLAIRAFGQLAGEARPARLGRDPGARFGGSRVKTAVTLAPPVIAGPARSRPGRPLDLRGRISASVALTKPGSP